MVEIKTIFFDLFGVLLGTGQSTSFHTYQAAMVLYDFHFCKILSISFSVGELN